MPNQPPRLAALRQLKSFDLSRARVSLWVFKKRSAVGPGLAFTALWVDIAPRLSRELKAIASAALDGFTEVSDFGLLQQPNDAELLYLPSRDTAFNSLSTAISGREEDSHATDRKELDNAAGYIVRIGTKDRAILCVRKVSSEWKSKASSSILNLLFVEQQMDIEEDPVFRISRSFDFFALDGSLLIADKRAFESLLNYRAKYETSFAELTSEPTFVSLFETTEPLKEYVGTNAMQLRRMAVIREKALYRDGAFIERLRSVNAERNWGIGFAADGKIIPTVETARIILQVLLDHRLLSELSLTTYDVPATTPV